MRRFALLLGSLVWLCSVPPAGATELNEKVPGNPALTYFDLARQYGEGELTKAVRTISARTLLIAFSSDWLYPPAGSEDLAAALRAHGKDVELHIIEAPYGHDCFLLEEARQTPMIQRFLAREAS